MLRASWKSLMGRKVRLLMSAFAVVLGVAFVSGSLIFTQMMKTSFDGIMNGTVGDVMVAPAGSSDSGMTSQSTAALTKPQLDAIAKVAGVESVAGTTIVQDAYPIGKNGKVIGGQGAPAIGGNVVTLPAFGHQQGLVLRSGRLPGPGEVVVDPGTLEKSGYQLGDTMRITSSGAQPVMKAKIVGTILWGAQQSTSGASYAMFDDATTQKQWMGGRPVWHGAWVTAKKGEDIPALVKRVQKEGAPKGFAVRSGEEIAKKTSDTIQQKLGVLTTFLLVFAGISLVVGSFLIVNTFSILVAQRSRELALLRAMGASRGQVRRSVLLEAFVTGLIGSTLGLLLGLGIARAIAALFAEFGLDMGGITPTLNPQAVVASYAVGMLVTMLAAYLPARKASRVPPVAAMTGAAMTGTQDLGKRLVLGIGTAVIGIGGLLAGLFWDGAPQRTVWIGVGALLTLLGVAFSSPVLGAPVLWALGKVYRGLFGQVGSLAALNAARNPRRTAATASALMIGLTLVAAMAVLGDSFKTSMRSTISEAMRGSYMYSNPTFMPFSPAVADRAAKVPGVTGVHRYRTVRLRLGSERSYLGAMGQHDFDKILAGTIVAGRLSDFRDGTMIVARPEAEKQGWKLGQTVTFTLNGKKLPLTVVALSEHPKGAGGGWVTTLGTLTRAGVPPADSQVTVDVAPGADRAKVRADLERVVKDLPMVSLQDQQEFADTQSASVDQIIMMMYALLGLAIIIAILGIVNTLALSVIERTREVGLLRAIGLKRGQLGWTIVLESVAIALLGSVLGLGMGALFGYAIVEALQDQGISLHMPWGQMLLFFVLAGLVGVLAAGWPARRAARMDVLRAIQTE